MGKVHRLASTRGILYVDQEPSAVTRGRLEKHLVNRKNELKHVAMERLTCCTSRVSIAALALGHRVEELRLDGGQ